MKITNLALLLKRLNNFNIKKVITLRDGLFTCLIGDRKLNVITWSGLTINQVKPAFKFYFLKVVLSWKAQRAKNDLILRRY